MRHQTISSTMFSIAFVISFQSQIIQTQQLADCSLWSNILRTFQNIDKIFNLSNFDEPYLRNCRTVQLCSLAAVDRSVAMVAGWWSRATGNCETIIEYRIDVTSGIIILRRLQVSKFVIIIFIYQDLTRSYSRNIITRELKASILLHSKTDS